MPMQFAGAYHAVQPRIFITALWCCRAEKRNALSAVYAFMRHADDISDEPGVDPQLKRQKLSEWLDAAKAVFAGKATDDPVLMALGDAQSKFKIPPELFEKLVYGTSLDLGYSAGVSRITGHPVRTLLKT